MDSASLQSVLVFGIDDRRFALELRFVERVVRAVEVTPLPGAPDLILGVINVQGRVVPVVNTRRRLGVHERGVAPDDCFILGHTTTRTVALVADTVEGVFAPSGGAVTASDAVFPGIDFVQGVLKTGAGLVLVQDIEQFLSAEDASSLDTLLAT